MNMNEPTGKKILALVRKGDYAHAGEEEAIDLAFAGTTKDPKRIILDVGCGRGGTAHYVQSKGWGRVLGVDIDADSIAHAKGAYPGVEFMAADVMSLSEKLSKKFDIVYLFNVLYVILDHPRLLARLRSLSREGGQLIIFDYLIKSQNKGVLPFKNWNPLDISIARSLFSASGWQINNVMDVSRFYEKWYRALVSRIEENADRITELAGEEWFNFAKTSYHNILESIEKGIPGGAIVYATVPI